MAEKWATGSSLEDVPKWDEPIEEPSKKTLANVMDSSRSSFPGASNGQTSSCLYVLGPKGGITDTLGALNEKISPARVDPDAGRNLRMTSPCCLGGAAQCCGGP